MPWFRVSDFDSMGGALADLPPQSIPPNIFTEVNNVVFRNGALEKATGVAAELVTPPSAPFFLLPARDNQSVVRLFAVCGQKIYSYSGGSWRDITRGVGGDYPLAGNNEWTGGVLHGVPFMNIAGTEPQYWDVAQGKFANLANWPAGYSCSAMRSFKNYMLALDYSDGADRYPHNIFWSHPADPGSVPASWDIADPTKDAGTTPVSETNGYIIDGLALGTQFAVYKENAIYMMQHVGAPYIFSFQLSSLESGILSRNCIAEVNNNHVVFGRDDIYMFNGQAPQSIVNRKWRKEIFSYISDVNYRRAFVVALPETKEVWFCVPSGVSQPTVAFIWNWGTNCWSRRDIPASAHIIRGYTTQTGTTWDSVAETWSTITGTWKVESGRKRDTFLAGYADGEIYTLGAAETLPAGAMPAYAMHESYDFAAKQQPDPADLVKHVSKIRPRVIAANDVVLNFQVGTQMNINDPITWGAVQPFTVGTDRELCLGANGRYISWKIYSDTDCTWRLEAIDFLLQLGGHF